MDQKPGSKCVNMVVLHYIIIKGENPPYHLHWLMGTMFNYNSKFKTARYQFGQWYLMNVQYVYSSQFGVSSINAAEKEKWPLIRQPLPWSSFQTIHFQKACRLTGLWATVKCQHHPMDSIDKTSLRNGLALWLQMKTSLRLTLVKCIKCSHLCINCTLSRTNKNWNWNCNALLLERLTFHLVPYSILAEKPNHCFLGLFVWLATELCNFLNWIVGLIGLRPFHCTEKIRISCLRQKHLQPGEM